MRAVCSAYLGEVITTIETLLSKHIDPYKSNIALLSLSAYAEQTKPTVFVVGVPCPFLYNSKMAFSPITCPRV